MKAENNLLKREQAEAEATLLSLRRRVKNKLFEDQVSEQSLRTLDTQLELQAR